MKGLIKLEKNRIYKVITTNNSFERDYLIFALKNDIDWYTSSSIYPNTIFLINLCGGFKIDSDMGLHCDSKIVELNISDWLELGCFLRGTKLRVNLRTRKVIDTELENWKITEI